MPTRPAIVAEARAWLDTPWQHQARARGEGVDCAGLVIGVARALALVPPDMDVSAYTRAPDGSMLDECDRWMRRIAPAEAQPGDVLVLRFGGASSPPQHMAVVADYRHGGLSIVHAVDHPDRPRARVVEQRLDRATRARVAAAYALPGVDDDAGDDGDGDGSEGGEGAEP